MPVDSIMKMKWSLRLSSCTLSPIASLSSRMRTFRDGKEGQERQAETGSGQGRVPAGEGERRSSCVHVLNQGCAG